MNEQHDKQTSTNQRRSRHKSKQNDTHVSALLRPTNHDKEAWKAYWEQRRQFWRREPEIDIERQKYLAARRAIVSNIKKGVYPFKDIEPKLTRADIEWLLETHESGGVKGPVDWEKEDQRKRKGLDLRGADLREVNLGELPLTNMLGGFNWEDLLVETNEQREAAAIHLERADLSFANLYGSILGGAHLERANLYNASLQRSCLSFAHLEEAKLASANLMKADLNNIHFESADLTYTYFVGADLREAHLERSKLYHNHLEGANLYGAFFDNTSELNDITLNDKHFGAVSLADIHWNDVNIAMIEWSQISVLGDEHEARMKRSTQRTALEREIFRSGYQKAVRAYRQLAVVLRNQGLNEEADRFAYRAQILQRGVWRRQGRYLKYASSCLLALLAGYGYRPSRSVFVYMLLILGFAVAFYNFGHLKWYEAIVVSLTAFHGRGFFSQLYQPGDPQSIIAAIEAVVGLLIEISFIATFTKRFFGS
jgi:uncharacterized protein YjbI with pentapeptide repeats